MSRCLCVRVRRCLLFAFTLLSAGLTLAQTASTQSWVLTGRVDVVEGTVPLPLAVGDPLRVVVTFDPAASFSIRASSDGRPGFRFEYGNHAALQLAIYGGGCNPCRPVSTAAKNGIYVRDSYADPGRNPAPDVPYDGISFFMDPTPANDDFGYSVILRDSAERFTPQVIAVTGNRPLPTTPDPRLVEMNTRVLQIAKGEAVLAATLSAVAVQPAPGPVTFNPADGRLRIPILRVGNDGYQDVELQLTDPAQMRFRLLSGVPQVPPAPASASYDVGLSQLSLPLVIAGSQQYRSVNLALDDPAAMGFRVTAGVAVDPALTLTRVAVSGLASFAGRGVGSGSVTARCADGHETGFELANDGSFAGELVTERSSPFPCLFRVDVGGGFALYSLMTSNQRPVSLSLLSTFTLAKSLRSDPGLVYAGFGTVHTFWPGTGLTDAPQFVVGALEGFSGYQTINYSDQQIPDVFSVTSTQDVTDRDRLFKAVDVALKAADLDYRALMTLIIAKAELRESFGTEIYKTMVERFVPTISGVECQVNSAKYLSCTITGRNLSYPAELGGRFSQLGISVALASLAQPKTDPTRPYTPPWCGRAVMEKGVATFISTDGTDWNGADPLEMFAEQITISPCGPMIDFEDELLVEVVKDNGDRRGPNGWEVIFGPGRLNVTGAASSGGGTGPQSCALSPTETFQLFDQLFGALTTAFPQNPSWGTRDTFIYAIFFGTRGLEILNQDSIRQCLRPEDYEANRAALQGAIDNGKAGCAATSTDGGQGCVAVYPGG